VPEFFRDHAALGACAGIAPAADIATAAAEQQGRHVYAASIPWSLVHRLRKDLEAAGVEWRSFKREHGR
jgi:hypothetical protein